MRQPPPNEQWCVGCDPDNCMGCGLEERWQSQPDGHCEEPCDPACWEMGCLKAYPDIPVTPEEDEAWKLKTTTP